MKDCGLTSGQMVAISTTIMKEYGGNTQEKEGVRSQAFGRANIMYESQTTQKTY